MKKFFQLYDPIKDEYLYMNLNDVSGLPFFRESILINGKRIDMEITYICTPVKHRKKGGNVLFTGKCGNVSFSKILLFEKLATCFAVSCFTHSLADRYSYIESAKKYIRKGIVLALKEIGAIPNDADITFNTTSGIFIA